ncbi:MAG TPA: hypothetical protein VFR85_16595 [Anaeromyxobacteraceae bacterium]|nr:hypothetical protein [Anaeromyxobacteraceae bacterium]
MADLSKRIAVLALVAAAGCRDSFPPIPGPFDRFYYPVGLAVRRLPPSPSYPVGRTALLVASTNFDLRYDYHVGGALLAVDPDASADALAGDPTLAVLGGVNIGSFGGEVDYLDGACAPLAAADPFVAGGGAKVVVASRGEQAIYLVDMDAEGRLTCDGCAQAVLPQALDPYDVIATCSLPGAGDVARAYVTHLRAPDNVGFLTELDLVLGTSSALYLGAYSTSSGGFDRATGRLFVSAQLPSINLVPLRWFNAVTLPPGGSPALVAHNVAADVHGALTRELAIYRYTDPATQAVTTTGYVRLELFDYDLASRGGGFVPTGGGLGVYDMNPNALGQPLMRLLKVVPICSGTGHVRVLPARQGARALLALTCDVEGTLQFYDDEVGAVVGTIGLDLTTGTPKLGRRPFGLAVEERAAGDCLPGPGSPGPCTRLYVSAFDSSWVNLVELDVAYPGGAAIVKRIGRERD